MSMAFRILKRDVMALLKNPIALLVVGALLVLPGLYAWYCILANWDPYSNTGNVPVAIVNKDRGAHNDLAGDVDIGKQVIESVKDNDKIDWRVYDDEEEALRDTQSSAVYATIVIPEDLSENLVGIFEGSSERPTIYYYPNEKYNAVATKVTDSAASGLVEQINRGFSSTVNKKALEATQKIVDKVEEKASEENQSAIAEIRQIRDGLAKTSVSLNDSIDAIQGWRVAAANANDALGVTANRLPNIRALLSDGSEQLDSFRERTGDFESELSSSVLQSASTVSELSSNAASTLAQATEDLQAVRTSIEALKKSAAGDEELEFAVRALESVEKLVEGIVDNVNGRVSEMNASVQEMSGSVKTVTSTLSTEVMPRLDNGTYQLATSMALLSGSIGQFEPQIDALRGVLAQTDGALVDATAAITDAQTLLTTVGSHLEGTMTDVGAIGNALRVEGLADLMNIDPESLGTFITTPVQMKTEKIFPVSNYGTAVAPFYTNLALWVGCFILVSLMKVEVRGEDVRSATRRERYFGRWWLFVILSLLQSQVICGVDILLGIDCANPALFMLAGAVCSFAYMNLIYALAKTFRNIGKTLCIFLLIMQVPGSSGMYPIEMMPDFFQFIHPALPFTYGIDAMREALCGMRGLAYFADLAVLLLIAPVSILLGLALRPLMGNLLALFDEEMNKAGFFASEEHEAEDPGRMRGLMRALASHSMYADDVEERAWRFRRVYKRWRKAGMIAIFVIPFVFLAFMLLVNLGFAPGIDFKLGALIIMLLVLFLVQIGLVALEYMNRVISEESRLLGASLMDDLGEDWDLESLTAQDKAEGSGEEAGMVPATLAAEGDKPKGGPIRDIFSTDFRLGMGNVVGVVVIVLLVVTPSMYAWFNIAGSWDPYGSTGNLKVAVANEDEGYKGELVPVTIKVGDTLVSQLRGNSNFNWVFVSKEEAQKGVENSEYYAAIEIPSDFSTSLMTYLTGDAEYPEVVYYTNEKENPIAPIITQKGANAIQESIRVNFTKRINEVVLSAAYDVLGQLSNPKLRSYADTMGGHLDDATHDAKLAARELRSLSSLAKTVSGIVTTTGGVIDGVKEAGASAEEAIGMAKSGAGDASEALDQAMSLVRESVDGEGIDIAKVKRIIDTALAVLEGGTDLVPAGIDAAIGEAESLRDRATTRDEKAKCNALIKALRTAKKHADAVPGDVAEAREKTEALVDTANSDVAKVKDYFENTVAPSAENLKSTLGEVSQSAEEVIVALKGALSGLDDSTDGLSGQLDTLSGDLNRVGDKLESSATKVEDLKARVVEALRSGNVQKVKEVILGSDPEALAASLANPAQSHREAMYAVPHYGSAMASFYTVLSLWVGALVMISTMRVRIVEERIQELRKRFGKVRPRHEFLGRYGIFGFIGLMQSSLVLLGDLLFLHIECANPVMFFICGVFVGQVFCLIVYTITELFGDVGKALCVILLIMQVAASGGTFPVEMLHPILLNVSSFLPFYYADTLMTECVGGIFLTNALICVAALLVMALAMLLMGIPLRRPFRKLNDFFEEQLEKTGYM